MHLLVHLSPPVVDDGERNSVGSGSANSDESKTGHQGDSDDRMLFSSLP
jgi:hypothetical protein